MKNELFRNGMENGKNYRIINLITTEEKRNHFLQNEKIM